MSESVITLPVGDPARVAAALRAVIAEDGARTARLRAGATETMVDDPKDLAAARWFQSLIEVGYLVASADELSDDERRAMARLLSELSGQVVDEDVLDLNFLQLEQSVAIMGRRPRLARAAAELYDQASREDALGFAALVSMSDGRLTRVELDTLVDLGGFLQVEPDRVRTLVAEIAGAVEAKLR